MAKTLRVPNESRFVKAFARAVDPGDTLSLLLEVSALGNRDLAIVRRTREALDSTYDRASNMKDWELVHTIGVLRQALAESDSAAYLAYAVQGSPQASHMATEFAEALAVVGCTGDSQSSRRRPWEIEPNDLSLPHWRERVWKLLFAIPGNALPKPTQPPASPGPPCTCNDADSPPVLPQPEQARPSPVTTPIDARLMPGRSMRSTQGDDDDDQTVSTQSLRRDPAPG